MNRAAERMRLLGKQRHDEGAPSAIFGSAAGLAQSIQTDERLRLSLYPILCGDMPEMAMGLASCLAYLLEQYPDTRVYRCFAKIDETDASGEITTEDYQFTLDDWELAGLADNVVIWGSLKTAEQFTLTLIADVSLLTNDDSLEFDFEFDSLSHAVRSLPKVAAQLIEALAGGGQAPAIVGYSDIGQGDLLDKLLQMVFDWNLDVYLQLWGEDWGETNISAQFDETLELERLKDGDFAAWCLGMMAKQVMQLGLEDIGETLVPQVFAAAKEVGPAAIPALAQGLAALDYYDEAISILERSLNPDAEACLWHRLGEILLDAGKFTDAVNIAQEALEAGLQHPALYMQYAQLLMTAEAHGWDIDDVLLIDPEEINEDAHITQEIANALKLYLTQMSRNLGALQLALSYMMTAEDDELWIWFERLVKADLDGEYLSEACDQLLDLADWSPAVDILQRHSNENARAFLYLAQLALEAGDNESAADWIAQCRAKIEDGDPLELELQGLDLRLNLEGFEETFAEIKLSLRAGRALSQRDMELLEAACEISPQLAESHLALAQGYLSWQDRDTAMEVMQQAQEVVGVDPQLTLGMVQFLLANQDDAEAMRTLNAGLEATPNDVPLLSQMAMILIAHDKMDEARYYISIAEAIAPSHSAIGQLRRLVAERMAQ